MIDLHNFETVNDIGWAILSIAIINFFLPYKDERKKYLNGMIVSGTALIIFILNMFFNIGRI